MIIDRRCRIIFVEASLVLIGSIRRLVPVPVRGIYCNMIVIVVRVVGIRSTIVVVIRSMLLVLLVVLVAMVLVLVLMRLREDVSISIGRTISILCRIAVMIVLRISRHVV